MLKHRKAYRDESADFDLNELDKGFLELDSSRFHRVAHHRIRYLTGSQLIWHIYQLAMAFAGNANSKITKEILQAIRLKLTTDRIARDSDEITKAMFDELKRMDDESHRFAHLIRELHALSLMLETERLNFKRVSKFSGRAEVQEIARRLQADFSDELAAHETNAA